MESTRQKKFARLIQKDLGEIFQQQSTNLFQGAFITVTHAKSTPDLSAVKVYLSFLLTNNKEATLRMVQAHSAQLRMILGQRIRHQVRKVPEITYYIDDTEEIASKIDKLFENIVIPPKTDEEEK